MQKCLCVHACTYQLLMPELFPSMCERGTSSAGMKRGVTSIHNHIIRRVRIITGTSSRARQQTPWSRKVLNMCCDPPKMQQYDCITPCDPANTDSCGAKLTKLFVVCESRLAAFDKHTMVLQPQFPSSPSNAAN